MFRVASSLMHANLNNNVPLHFDGLNFPKPSSTWWIQKMTQQIYDDHLKSTHDTLKEWGPHKAIGFCWDRWSLQLDCTQCSFFNNYKNMNHTLTCQSKPSKCLYSHRHKRPFHKRWRVWISDQRMQCLGISEWKISVNEKQTQIHWREIKELESWL